MTEYRSAQNSRIRKRKRTFKEGGASRPDIRFEVKSARSAHDSRMQKRKRTFKEGACLQKLSCRIALNQNQQQMHRIRKRKRTL